MKSHSNPGLHNTPALENDNQHGIILKHGGTTNTCSGYKHLQSTCFDDEHTNQRAGNKLTDNTNLTMKSMNDKILGLEQTFGNTRITPTVTQFAIPTQPSNPFGTSRDTDNTKKLNEAMRLLGNNFSFDGSPEKWSFHKQKLKNVFWSLDMNKENSIKLIKLSMTNKAVFMCENVDVDLFLNSMNGEAVEQYLEALERLFIGTASKELSRSKFNSAKQETNESTTLWLTRLKVIFKTAFPTVSQIEQHEILKDRFLSGLLNSKQKKIHLRTQKTR